MAVKNLFSKERFIILDGALGTMLQRAGLKAGERPEALCFTAPEKLVAVHRAYIEAGAELICANTFGASPQKLAGSGLECREVIAAAVGCAKQAAGNCALVALDIGPLGELLEPAGSLQFEDAYDAFATMMKAGERAGADVILVETMTDLYEAKAALLAARENTRLPVMVSMSFEANGRSFSGTPVEAMAAALAPLGPVALGINCSLGPAGIMPLTQRLCAATQLPVFVKPNAGLPDPATGAYALTPGDFCAEMEPCLAMGVSMVGGCCGTTPEFIAALREMFGDKAPAARVYTPISLVASGTKVVKVNGVCPIGERINPTGKKRLREALQAGDLGYVQTLAVEQEAAGASILDVNVGAPGVDEEQLLPRVVKAVQAVSALPVQLDSANPKALAAALRVVNGKAVVNSTSGEEEKMCAVLPLCAEYGAAVVGLALDEAGIPRTAEERFAIAEKILFKAQKCGIPREDVWIDCLTLAAAAEPEAPQVTLAALRLVKQRLSLKTVLGVSNVSFGLPQRGVANRAFLTMAMANGLDLPIFNPCDSDMMDAVAAFRLLGGEAEGAAGYLARFGGETGSKGAEASREGAGRMRSGCGCKGAAPAPIGTSGAGQGLQAPNLQSAILAGLKEEAARAANALLQSGVGGVELAEGHMMPALDEVGRRYEAGTIFLPQLLASAGAAQAAFEAIRAAQPESPGGPPIVVATVKGDVHDIGKNIAKTMLENYGFTVIDLGRDVNPARVVEAARQSGAKLVGLSALMTTTLPSMEATIRALREAELPCEVMVGGAVLTEEYALAIGADYYVKDAKASADVAKKVHGM